MIPRALLESSPGGTWEVSGRSSPGHHEILPLQHPMVTGSLELEPPGLAQLHRLPGLGVLDRLAAVAQSRHIDGQLGDPVVLDRPDDHALPGMLPSRGDGADHLVLVEDRRELVRVPRVLQDPLDVGDDDRRHLASGSLHLAGIRLQLEARRPRPGLARTVHHLIGHEPVALTIGGIDVDAERSGLELKLPRLGDRHPLGRRRGDAVRRRRRRDGEARAADGDHDAQECVKAGWARCSTVRHGGSRRGRAECSDGDRHSRRGSTARLASPRTETTLGS